MNALKLESNLKRAIDSHLKTSKSGIYFILDISSSFIHGENLTRIISYILKRGIPICMIQIDLEVRCVSTLITIDDYKNTKILGGDCGTILQPAINLISSKGITNKEYDSIIMYTDGYTDDLNFSEISASTLIISTESKCNIKVDNGKVNQILINQ